MEGASDVVAGHRATVAHVGAEVLAVRVENHQTTVLGAVGDEVVAEVPQRLDVATWMSVDQPIWNHPVGFIDKAMGDISSS